MNKANKEVNKQTWVLLEQKKMVKGVRSQVWDSDFTMAGAPCVKNQDEFQGNKMSLMSFKMKAPEWKVYFLPLDGQQQFLILSSREMIVLFHMLMGIWKAF